LIGKQALRVSGAGYEHHHSRRTYRCDHRGS
jgi:hypothetical protein